MPHAAVAVPLPPVVGRGITAQLASPKQHPPAPHATLFGTPAYQTLLQALQHIQKTAHISSSPTSELALQQAQFIQSHNPAATQFLQLVEYWSDVHHSRDWLLLPGAAPSKYLLALLALHCFDATAVGENERQYATILPSAPEYQL